VKTEEAKAEEKKKSVEHEKNKVAKAKI